ncbi:hypothetical protein DM02DRAFT_212288 [Periconia macrospinosa]|uniref:Uncharacterized protein n=1 Tax=Periconia macrospinosa TaxID=97972 RepID=A0A2V1D9F9_9PLEO|nr:hypothetical protein DM02DRAFT_212288 [Periconia macrospinosa]
MGKYSNQTYASFGVALSGRDAPIEGIEGMTGRTNATIPVRYQLLASNGHSPSIADVLELAQSQTTEMNRFQHHGLQNIMRISPECLKVNTSRSRDLLDPHIYIHHLP